MATRNYQDAIEHLNTLQTSADTLEAARAAGSRLNPDPIPKMIEFLERIGYTCEDLNNLNVIHVTGTKGKGSTCAFTDSILRHARPDWKIGLYTSPHLVAVRERIRIGGVPLSEDDFARYFFEVWDRLQQNGPRTPDFPVMPSYFRYLTLMAFHTFLAEKVNATILEVGVGGVNDSTNIVPRPVVTGIAALGLDHTSVLGRTIAAIAEKKGGIYKNGVPALSVSQPEEGMIVLKERAKASKVRIDTPFKRLRRDTLQGLLLHGSLLPPGDRERYAGYSHCILPPAPVVTLFSLGLAGEHQLQNATLAVQMAYIFLRSMDGLQCRPEPLSQLPESLITGLENAKWPGRCQTVLDPKYHNITWYLDGAHTSESLHYCAHWFVNPRVGLYNPPTSATPTVNGVSGLTAETSLCTRVLIFNCTKGRSGLNLLSTILEETKNLLLQYGSTEHIESFFQHVIFCSNVTYADGRFKGDLTSRAMSADARTELKAQHELADAWSQLVTTFPTDSIHVVPSIEHAVQTVRGISATFGRVSVLVTGSLHLVGGVIEVADYPRLPSEGFTYRRV
ncbi:Mur ligase [Pisolithus marmoratus]|nr:Mur ligase [Pisolithus marmoratus]